MAHVRHPPERFIALPSSRSLQTKMETEKRRSKLDATRPLCLRYEMEREIAFVWSALKMKQTFFSRLSTWISSGLRWESFVTILMKCWVLCETPMQDSEKLSSKQCPVSFVIFSQWTPRSSSPMLGANGQFDTGSIWSSNFVRPPPPPLH